MFNNNLFLHQANNQNNNLQNKDFVWNTEKILKEIEKINGGLEADYLPFYEKNIDLKNNNIIFEYTKEELEIYAKCVNDVIYFSQFCKVMTDEGYQYIKLRDYQEDCLKKFQKHRKIIFLASRQIGKSIMSAIFIVWYICTHKDRNIMIVANKGATTVKLLNDVKEIIKGLPFFLKPGVISWGQTGLKFDNGVNIYTQSTTSSTAVGFTIHLLYADEFAHIPKRFIKEMYRSIFPTLSSSKISRIIITSTANGPNFFYELYINALNKKNDYVPLRVDWWEVPGRDENWKRKEIANLGSEEMFNQEYGNQFFLDGQLLLNTQQTTFFYRIKQKFVYYDLDLDNILDIENLIWYNKINLDNLKKEKILITIDLADGSNKDFSVFNIFKIEIKSRAQIKKIKNHSSESEFFRLRQIGLFYSNKIQMQQFSQLLVYLINNIFNKENVFIIFEYNFNGSYLFDKLINFGISEENFLFTKHSVDSKIKKPGIRLGNNRNKIFLEFKECLRNKQIIFLEEKTFNQISSFGIDKNGKFVSQLQNDDIALSTIIASQIFGTDYWEDIIFDYIQDNFEEGYFEKLLYEKEQKEIKNEEKMDFSMFNLVKEIFE